MPNLPLIPGQLGYNCYPANPQTLINDAMQVSVALLNSALTGVIVSDTEPSAADRDKVWFRTSAGAPVFPSLWSFFLGQWLARHPIAAGTLWALPYTGDPATIPTLDGGSAGVINTDGTTGPFWEEVVSLQARFPIGAGTLPSGKVLAVGDTGGEESVILAADQANHFHGFGDGDTAGRDALLCRRSWSSIPVGTGIQNVDTTVPATITTPGMSGGAFGTSDSIATSADTVAHENMTPYLTLTFLRRTSRIYATTPIA